MTTNFQISIYFEHNFSCFYSTTCEKKPKNRHLMMPKRGSYENKKVVKKGGKV